MTFLKRVAGVLVFLVAFIFLGACGYGIVESWILKPKLTESSTRILGQMNDLLDSTSKGIREVQSALVQARANLNEAKEATAKPAGDDASRRLALSLAAWKIKEEFGPQLGNVRTTLTGVTQAAIVANTLVQDLDKTPLSSVSSLDVERLQTSAGKLSDLGKSAQELSQLLAGPDGKGGQLSQRDLENRTTPIQNTLAEVQQVAADFEIKVDEYRNRVALVRSRASDWINWGVLAITGLLLWIGFSQLSVMCHGWEWIRGSKEK